MARHSAEQYIVTGGQGYGSTVDVALFVDLEFESTYFGISLHNDEGVADRVVIDIANRGFAGNYLVTRLIKLEAVNGAHLKVDICGQCFGWRG